MQAEKHTARLGGPQEERQTMAARMAHLQPENMGTSAAQPVGRQVQLLTCPSSVDVLGAAVSVSAVWHDRANHIHMQS